MKFSERKVHTPAHENSTEVSVADVKHLESMAEGLKEVETILLSLDPHTKKIQHTRCLHWQEGLKELF